MEWTRQDAAECGRLVAEMSEDTRWQLQLFTFGVTAAALALSVLARGAPATETVVSPGLFWLGPLFVLVPASLMILNRARARNRKAAYMIVTLDYKRLLIEGVTDSTSLAEIRRRSDVPWETALHILERTNQETNTKPHLARALAYMTMSSLFSEILFISLAFLETWSTNNILVVVVGFALVDASLIATRCLALRDLKRSTSIQGYVAHWLRLRYRNDHRSIPRYLSEWTDECEQLGRNKVFKV